MEIDPNSATTVLLASYTNHGLCSEGVNLAGASVKVSNSLHTFLFTFSIKFTEVRQQKYNNFSPRFPPNLVTEDSEKNGDSLTEDVLIFTRIPKSGTENWVKLLKDLSTVNEFKHSSSQHKMRIKSANVQVG